MKSRVSHRYIQFSYPETFGDFLRIAEGAFLIDDLDVLPRDRKEFNSLVIVTDDFRTILI